MKPKFSLQNPREINVDNLKMYELKSAGISEKEGISSRQINEPSIECKNKNS
jgi:hypothetical protein